MIAVQKPITTQPLPVSAEHTSDSATLPVDEVVVTQPLPEVPILNNETADRTEETADRTEEEQKKKRQEEDCCFYLEPDDGNNWLILCRCMFWICRSIGTCTESCCDNCAECINNCCDGNEGCCEGNEGCCDGNEGCCDGNEGCCDGDGVSNGDSGGDFGNCCDCTSDD